MPIAIMDVDATTARYISYAAVALAGIAPGYMLRVNLRLAREEKRWGKIYGFPFFVAVGICVSLAGIWLDYRRLAEYDEEKKHLSRVTATVLAVRYSPDDEGRVDRQADVVYALNGKRYAGTLYNTRDMTQSGWDTALEPGANVMVWYDQRSPGNWVSLTSPHGNEMLGLVVFGLILAGLGVILQISANLMRKKSKTNSRRAP